MTTPQRLYDEAVLNYEGARAELDAAIKRLGYAEGFEAGREFERGEAFASDDVTDAIAESFASGVPFKSPITGNRVVRVKSAQELRDEIVEAVE